MSVYLTNQLRYISYKKCYFSYTVNPESQAEAAQADFSLEQGQLIHSLVSGQQAQIAGLP